MKNTSLYLLLVIALFSSCRTSYYSPRAVNVPLIEKKGEVNCSAAFVHGMVDTESSLVDFQASLGLTDNLSLIAGMGFLNSEYSESGREFIINFPYGSSTYGEYYSTEGSNSYQSTEIGLGHYRKLKKNGVLEVYGIFSVGKLERSYVSRGPTVTEINGDISSDFRKIGAQINLGNVGERSAIAFSLKAFHLQYYNIVGDLIYDNRDQNRYLHEHDSHFVIEPAVTLRFGPKNFMLQIQATRNYNSSFNKSDRGVGLLDVGIFLNFNKAKKPSEEVN